MGFDETTEPLFGQTMKLHILEVGTGSSGFRGKLGEMLGLFSVLGSEKSLRFSESGRQFVSDEGKNEVCFQKAGVRKAE